MISSITDCLMVTGLSITLCIGPMSFVVASYVKSKFESGTYASGSGDRFHYGRIVGVHNHETRRKNS